MSIDLKTVYNKNGYVVVKRLFDKCEINDILTQIFNVYNTYCKSSMTDHKIMELFKVDNDGFIGCAHAAQSLLCLSRLQADDRIVNILKILGLSSPAINTRPLISISSRKTAINELYWRMPPHQDWPSTQGSINGVTVWIPLIDVTSDLGPLECVPQSHIIGSLPHVDVGTPVLSGDYKFDAVPMDAGDALFFSWFTIHRSGNNVSDKIRWTTHFRYNDLAEPTFIDRKYPRHREERRKKGILHPGVPSVDQLKDIFYHPKPIV